MHIGFGRGIKKMYWKFILRSIFSKKSLKSLRMLIFSCIADCFFSSVTSPKVYPMIAINILRNVICNMNVAKPNAIQRKV